MGEGMKQWLRYGLAVTAPQFVAPVVLIPCSIALDVLWGGEVVGGDWHLNIPNVAIWLINGWFIGWLAGWIAHRRGRVIGLIAILLPSLLGVLLLTVLLLNDPSLTFALNNSGHKRLMFACFGILPAMLGGQVAVKLKPDGLGKSLEALAAACVLVAGAGGFALHIWTVAIAWQVSGFMGAATTFSLPFVSEIYWLFEGWLDHRYFAVLYSLRIGLYLSWWVAIVGLFVISARLERTRERKASTPSGGDRGLEPTEANRLHSKNNAKVGEPTWRNDAAAISPHAGIKKTTVALPPRSNWRPSAEDVAADQAIAYYTAIAAERRGAPSSSAGTLTSEGVLHPKVSLAVSRERLRRMRLLLEEPWLSPARKKVIANLVRAQACVFR